MRSTRSPAPLARGVRRRSPAARSRSAPARPATVCHRHGLGVPRLTSRHAGPRRRTTALGGQTLTIAATGAGSTATNITFGTDGQISTLNSSIPRWRRTICRPPSIPPARSASRPPTMRLRRRSARSAVRLRQQRCGVRRPVGGAAPVADPNSQATRASLIAQYNNVLQQINTTAQDSSFNGINLLNGDTLNLTFDETGKSKLAITGVTFNAAGLGLSPLTPGTDFLDSNSANSVLTAADAAPAPRCARKHRASVRTCRSCRSARTSTRT